MKKRLKIYLFLVPWVFGFLPIYHFLTAPMFSSESGYTPHDSPLRQIGIIFIWLLPPLIYAIWEIILVAKELKSEKKTSADESL